MDYGYQNSDVWIKLHVGHGGTFVTTPTVDSSAAAVAVRTHVVNEGAGQRQGTLQAMVLDASGRAVVHAEHPFSVAAGQDRNPGDPARTGAPGRTACRRGFRHLGRHGVRYRSGRVLRHGLGGRRFVFRRGCIFSGGVYILSIKNVIFRTGHQRGIGLSIESVSRHDACLFAPLLFHGEKGYPITKSPADRITAFVF